MKTSIVSILIVLGSLLQAGGTTPTRPADSNTEMATGAVLSFEASLLVLELESGVRRRFTTSETTLMPMEPLRTGDLVSVKYRPGTLPANVVELVVLWQAPLETALDSGDHPDAF